MMLGKEIFWEKMHLTSFDWTVKISINSLVFLCTAVNNFNLIYASFCSNSTFEVLKTQLSLALAQQENAIRFVDSVENRFSPMFFPHLKQSENLSLFHQLPQPKLPKRKVSRPWDIAPASASKLLFPNESSRKKKARNPSAYAILPPRRYYHLAILSPRTPLGSRFMCISFFPRQLFTRILFYFPSQCLACLRHTHTTPKTDSFVLGSPFSWWNKFSAHNIYRIGLF